MDSLRHTLYVINLFEIPKIEQSNVSFVAKLLYFIC